MSTTEESQPGTPQRLFEALQFTVARCVAAFVLVIMIAYLRAPFTDLPSSLFVSDGFGYYIYLPSTVIDRDLDLSNQITQIPYEGDKQFFQVAPRTGRNTNQFPVGSAIFWLPFFLAADFVALMLNELGWPINRDGFGYFYELPVYVGSFAYGLAAIYLMQRTLKRLFSAEVAAASLFGVVFATPLAYYCWVEPNMSHTVAMFTVTLWLWRLCIAYDENDDRMLTWVTLGILLGLAGLVRPYNAVLGIVAVPVAFSVVRPHASQGARGVVILRAAWRLVTCCCIALLMLAPQVLVWKLLYGEWFVVPRGSGYEKMRWVSPTWDSYPSTVLIFNPLYGIGLFGLFVGLTAAFRYGDRTSLTTPRVEGYDDEKSSHRLDFSESVSSSMLIVWCAISLIIAGSRDWNLGTAFGQRRMVDWSMFFAIGLGLVLSRLPSQRIIQLSAAWCILALSVWQCLLAATYLLKPGFLPEYGILLSQR